MIMLKRFRNYIEHSDWDRHIEEDHAALTVLCWAAIIFSIIWFGPTMLRILIDGPAK
jgi:hypothetical protein